MIQLTLGLVMAGNGKDRGLDRAQCSDVSVDVTDHLCSLSTI